MNKFWAGFFCALSIVVILGVTTTIIVVYVANSAGITCHTFVPSPIH